MKNKVDLHILSKSKKQTPAFHIVFSELPVSDRVWFVASNPFLVYTSIVGESCDPSLDVLKQVPACIMDEQRELKAIRR